MNRSRLAFANFGTNNEFKPTFGPVILGVMSLNLHGRMMLQSERWTTDLLSLDDELSIGLVLVACSRVMLPYWESHCPSDDKLELVVSAMNEWALKSTAESQEQILKALKLAAVESEGYLSPVEPVPVRSDCPGDYACDSIIAAANAIMLIGQSDFHYFVETCLSDAARTIAEMMGHRQPDNESTDFWSLALDHLRNEIVNQLPVTPRYATRDITSG